MLAHLLFLLFKRSIATQAAAAAGAAMMSSAFARSNFAAAAPAAAAALSLSVAQLAHLHTAFLLGYLVGHVPAGLLADRFGGARVLLYAALAWSGITCAHALVGVAPPGLALPLLAALRFGVGVASAAAVPALAATLAQMLPEAQRAKIMSASYGARPPVLLRRVAATHAHQHQGCRARLAACDARNWIMLAPCNFISLGLRGASTAACLTRAVPTCRLL